MENRFRQYGVDDDHILKGLSRRPNKLPWTPDERVVEEILRLRDELPQQLGSTAGAKTILYYLQQDTALWLVHQLPRSVSTIKKILHEYGRILPKVRRLHTPIERPAPMVRWEVDVNSFIEQSARPGELVLIRIGCQENNSGS